MLARSCVARPERAIADRVIIGGGGGDQLGLLRAVADQSRGDPDRAAGVEHVDHRARIGRGDAQRGVGAAGGRAADQQRHGHARRAASRRRR